MKKTIRIILYISSSLIYISCSKSKTEDRSAKLVLLQNTWTFNSITMISTVDATQQGKLYPYQTTAEYNINAILYFTSPNPSSTFSRPYNLLADDSTLIFTINDNTGIFYDTNHIFKLTSNELIYHGFNREKTLFVIDSLTR